MNDDRGVSRGESDSAPRLQITPNSLASAYVDGAWWPRSTRLAIELPALVAALSDRLGQVAVVGYHLNAWTETPPQVQIAGLTVHLQGFTSEEPASVILIGR
ncbi:DUF5994 family protein, partial [Mycobacterium sp.]|uniref:DUF5994 family protein n=1 Tax=Mycobacterium sp. TaxID=1785 RepID=UPI002C4574BF